MRVTLLQLDIVWASPAVNVRRADQAIDALAACDLIVLPEMFATGFATQPEGIAEPDPSPTLAWMQRKAAERDCALAGSLAVATAEGYRNRFYFVRPDGTYDCYDKHHLFTFGGEHERYTAGQRRVVVDWRGVRFLLQVCYDLRFPFFSRNRDDYDCALYVASWPTPRVEAWSTLLHARAIENQCYVVGVNRVGSDPACEYCGASAIIDPYGRDIATTQRGTEDNATADIDMEALEAFRQKFPVLRDRDAMPAI